MNELPTAVTTNSHLYHTYAGSAMIASLRMATAWSTSLADTVSGGTRRMMSPLPAVMISSPLARQACRARAREQ